jgi:uncharacterized membrane protein YqjE
MNPPPEIRQIPPVNSEAGPGAAPPASLLEALIRLVDSRTGLIRIESKAAMESAAKRAILTAGAFACLLFAWLLLLTATIQLVADALDYPWSWVAIGFALIHLLGGIFMSLAARSGPEAFPATRAEFKKDREWIENFKTKKSNG